MTAVKITAGLFYSRLVGITLNEVLDVTVSNGVITLAKSFHHKTLEERAAEFDGKLMLDGEYDWGEPV